MSTPLGNVKRTQVHCPDQTSRHKVYRVALFARARKLAQLVYRMLRWGNSFREIGDTATELRFRYERVAGTRRKAESLGYKLVLQARPPA